MAARAEESPKVYNNLACIFASKGDEILSHLYFKKALKAASYPIKITGLYKLIEENLDYWANHATTKGMDLLRELNP